MASFCANPHLPSALHHDSFCANQQLMQHDAFCAPLHQQLTSALHHESFFEPRAVYSDAHRVLAATATPSYPLGAHFERGPLGPFERGPLDASFQSGPSGAVHAWGSGPLGAPPLYFPATTAAPADRFSSPDNASSSSAATPKQIKRAAPKPHAPPPHHAPPLPHPPLLLATIDAPTRHPPKLAAPSRPRAAPRRKSPPAPKSAPTPPLALATLITSPTSAAPAPAASKSGARPPKAPAARAGAAMAAVVIPTLVEKELPAKRLGSAPGGKAKVKGKADRKPYHWSGEEHVRFMQGLALFSLDSPGGAPGQGKVSVGLGPGVAEQIAVHVTSRSVSQVRSHAQKYFLRLYRGADKQ